MTPSIPLLRCRFRTVTGDLGLRPIFRQLPERIEAHLFIAFLAYCLSITLRQKLRTVAGGLMPRAVLEKLATVQMLDVTAPTTDGRDLLLVRRTEPSREVPLLLEPSRPDASAPTAAAYQGPAGLVVATFGSAFPANQRLPRLNRSNRGSGVIKNLRHFLIKVMDRKYESSTEPAITG